MECEQVCRKVRKSSSRYDSREKVETLKRNSQAKHVDRMRKARQGQQTPEPIKTYHSCDSRFVPSHLQLKANDKYNVSMYASSEMNRPSLTTQPRKKERQKWHDNTRNKDKPLELFKLHKNLEKLRKRNQNRMHNILYKPPVYDTHQMKHIIRIRNENARRRSCVPTRYGFGIENEQPKQKKLKRSGHFYEGDITNVKAKQSSLFNFFSGPSEGSPNNTNVNVFQVPQFNPEPNHVLPTTIKQPVDNNINKTGDNNYRPNKKVSDSGRKARLSGSASNKNYFIFNQNKIVPLNTISTVNDVSLSKWNQTDFLEFIEQGDHIEIPIEELTPQFEYSVAKTFNSSKIINSATKIQPNRKPKTENINQRIWSNDRRSTPLIKPSEKNCNKSKSVEINDQKDFFLKIEPTEFILQPQQPSEPTLDDSPASEDLPSQRPVIFFPQVSVIDLMSGVDPSLMNKNDST